LSEAEYRRKQAYDSLLRTFEKRRFMRAILCLAAWIEAGRWLSRKKARSVKTRAVSAADRASGELGHRWKRIRKRAPRIRKIDDRQRHRLRIKIKDLRYGIEFFASTFPKRKAESRRKSMLAVLEDLQDELGGMNDLVVSEQLFPDRTSAQKRHSQARMTKLMSHAEASARKLRGLKPFWD
jgi:triphosphatase